ncbi:MAG: insulinase family protein [Spirochaetota bacterium]
MKVGDALHGFTVTHIDSLEEYHGRGIRLRHDKTGLELYHLHNDDRENLFAFAFKTPPSDDTGVAHILEHTVLSGSRNYPVKDPFLALMRGSVNTFLNAMTYPDKTVYPAASTVKKDYYNIMSVYADAVFFPLLKKELFLQEGRRFVPQDDGSLKVEGIVFNEMKGSFSSFDSIVGDWSYRSLFDKAQYRHESGGTPQAIPQLTYEQFVDFHKSYYHPSNCRVFLYGNIPTEEQLQFLQDNYLREFDAGQSAPDIPEEPVWEAPRSFTVKGPAVDGEEKPKPTITINWRTGTSVDPKVLLSMQVLSAALIGHPGTPLQKLINDTELGEDMSPVSGLETDIRDLSFTVGMRGIAPEKAADFEELVLKELQRLADDGLPRDVINGTLRRVEFQNREIRGGAPFGLRMMSKALRGWLHGAEPRTTLEFTPHIEQLKKEYEQNPNYFEELIEGYLLHNPHRSTVIAEPDSTYMDDLEQEISQSVEHIQAEMSSEELQHLKTELETFERFQNTLDPAEALQSIPILSRDDLPEDISIIETKDAEVDGLPAFTHDLFTNGIIYIDFAFNITDLSERERLLLPLLGRIMTSTGLPGRTYDEVARQLSLKTGGLSPYLDVSPVVGDPQSYMGFLFVRLKCLEDSLDDALELTFDLLQSAQVDDARRLWEILTEFRNDMRSAIIPAGHSFSTLRAGAHLEPAVRIEDEWRGIEQLLFLTSLPSEAGAQIEALGQELKALRDKLLTRQRLLLNMSAEGSQLQRIRSEVAQHLARFSPGGEGGSLSQEYFTSADGRLIEPYGDTWESLQVPASVGYSGMAMPGLLYGKPGYAAYILVAHLLKTDYLWQKIRMQGGAYGAAASTHGLEGIFSFLSYRDPHVEKSLQVYEDGLAHIAVEGVSEEDLEKAVIAIVGKDTRPKSPSEKSVVGLKRRLYGISDELRRQTRHQMLEVKVSDVKSQAAALHEQAGKAVRVAMAEAKLLDKAEHVFNRSGQKRVIVPM